MEKLFGGIEAGGTKFLCAVGDASGAILDTAMILTTTPKATLDRAIEFFKDIHDRTPLAAIGVASFGPVDLDPRSPYFGFITTPPKPGWADCDIRGPISRALGIPVGFDTDVNAAALGEHRWGAARGLDTFLYLTVGTGIGAGALARGEPMHGLLHPEMGHMFVPHDAEEDAFAGVCPFHGDCLEGLASGPALERRWGVMRASELPDRHPAWELEARYLGYACANLTMMLSPERIILGGGVSRKKGLLPLVRAKTREFLNGYIRHERILESTDQFIVEPGLGDRSGILGALNLAERALLGRETSP